LIWDLGAGIWCDDKSEIRIPISQNDAHA